MGSPKILLIKSSPLFIEPLAALFNYQNESFNWTLVETCTRKGQSQKENRVCYSHKFFPLRKIIKKTRTAGTLNSLVASLDYRISIQSSFSFSSILSCFLWIELSSSYMALDIPIINAEIINTIFLFIQRKGPLSPRNLKRLLLFCLYISIMIND